MQCYFKFSIYIYIGAVLSGWKFYVDAVCLLEMLSQNEVIKLYKKNANMRSSESPIRMKYLIKKKKLI